MAPPLGADYGAACLVYQENAAAAQRLAPGLLTKRPRNQLSRLYPQGCMRRINGIIPGHTLPMPPVLSHSHAGEMRGIIYQY